jgi:hypothetical protein
MKKTFFGGSKYFSPSLTNSILSFFALVCELSLKYKKITQAGPAILRKIPVINLK